MIILLHYSTMEEFVDKLKVRKTSLEINSEASEKKHYVETDNIVYTRFPPEPNGYLHLGHALALFFDFEGFFKLVDKVDSGKCILRLDDTNPEKENSAFVDSIIDDIRWLDVHPCKITYTSDYFDNLYEYAIELIRKGKAYVCHNTSDEIKIERENIRKKIYDGSPWRNTSIEENLEKFDKMKNGYYDEGSATLRLKIDLTSPNPCMWDPVAYRIKKILHPRTNDKWVIYPSYDFSHCITDSLENIDFSFCSLEFEVRRDLYYWTLNELNLWKPIVWEFGRLEISGHTLSKRKIQKMVDDGVMDGWDDPRLLTIKGLRKRGYTKDIIKKFCEEIGVSRSGNTTIEMDRLEHVARSILDKTASRIMVVKEPIKVNIINMDPFIDHVCAKHFPSIKDSETYEVAFDDPIYIESSDFQIAPEAKYYGLSPDKEISLRYAGCNIKCLFVDECGNITAEKKKFKRIKKTRCLHWVSSPKEITVIDYDNDGNKVIYNGKIDVNIFPGTYQFERWGYYIITDDYVAHQIVSLKSSFGKKL